jgi:D-threonine aldolase
VLVDAERPAEWLSQATVARGVTAHVMVDLDTGLHRTGLPVGEPARNLCRFVAGLPGLEFAGLHVYDAQNNKFPSRPDRQAAVEHTIAPVLELARALERDGLETREILCGGSGTFPCYAELGEPIVCSPGTTVFWDRGYSTAFPDLDTHFKPAVLLLSRVVSRPSELHLTLDLGTKAIASDPPIGKRGWIVGMEAAQTVLHNEEHWTVTSVEVPKYRVGDSVLVVPQHVCPNANLYPVLYVVDPSGAVVDRWDVVARQRPVEL